MNTPDLIHKITDAIEAIETAYRSAPEGLTADHLKMAERDCYLALDKLIRSKYLLAETLQYSNTGKIPGSL